MPNYVALIRGVAPSIENRNNAAILRALATLDLTGLSSVLSSGNYLFASDLRSTDKLEALISDALAKELGVELLTIVRSQKQIQALVDGNPLAGAPHGAGSYQLVTFFKHPIDLGFDLPYHPEGKFFKLVGSVDGTLFTVSDNTGGQTVDTMAWLERHYTRDLTSRTPLTLQKILKKLKQLS
ncbi:MAG: DUF1697 domain-containing protein [Coriobacteriia bacterium]|nr:DUF1697 domain-containing protein [Coriobacteriia bacterium]